MKDDPSREVSVRPAGSAPGRHIIYGPAFILCTGKGHTLYKLDYVYVWLLMSLIGSLVFNTICIID